MKNIDFTTDAFGARYRALIKNLEFMMNNETQAVQLLQLRKDIFNHGM